MNTSEKIVQDERNEVVDTYAKKLVNSGYSLEQSRKFIVSGLSGYERRLALSKDVENSKWRPLHEGAGYNAKARRIKKMTSKTSWYKRSRDQEEVGGTSPPKRRKMHEQVQSDGEMQTRVHSRREMHAQVWGEGGMREQVQMMGEIHEHVQGKGEMHEHAQGEGSMHEQVQGGGVIDEH